MIKKIKDTFWNRNFFIFVIIGTINTAVYNILYLVGLNHLNYMISNIISYFIAMTISFFLNCKFNFKVKPTLKKYLLFPLTGIASFCCTTGGLIILVDILNLNEKLCGLISSLIAVPITFIIMKYVLKGDKTINILKEE